jgi:non-ribosomal peptide synthetase component F
MNDFFYRFFDELGDGEDLPAIIGTSSCNLTYRELDGLVISYCNRITSITGEEKRVIAIVSTRNTYNAAAILAVIKSGNAYLPIEPSNPVKRILEYLDGVSPFAVLVENKVLKNLKLAEHLLITAEYKLDEAYTMLILNEPADCVYTDTVQLLYTSGSTGRPKAVVHSYDSMTSFIKWSVSTFARAAGSNVLAVAPSSFDLSVFDLFFSLHTRSCLVIPSDAELVNVRLLASVISQYQIGLIYATPSFFKLLVENNRSAANHYPHIKYILLAGELVTWQLLHQLNTFFDVASFFNLYGPTESNVCSYYPVNFSDEGKFPDSVPIGRACAGMVLELRTESEQWQELIISGPSLFKGYISGRVFTLIDTWYSSGDLVKFQDEQLVFVKRADRMIKRNGYRIEPFELERCISQLPGVERVLVAQVMRDEKMILVAYIQTQAPYSKLQIKQYCLDHLPHYFLPDSIILLNYMPLNTNFKPDLLKLIENYSR